MDYMEILRGLSALAFLGAFSFVFIKRLNQKSSVSA